MVEIRFCLKCKSENVKPLLGLGGFTGTFKCNDCGFIGEFPIKVKKVMKKKKFKE